MGDSASAGISTTLKSIRYDRKHSGGNTLQAPCCVVVSTLGARKTSHGVSLLNGNGADSLELRFSVKDCLYNWAMPFRLLFPSASAGALAWAATATVRPQTDAKPSQKGRDDLALSPPTASDLSMAFISGLIVIV